MPNLLLLNPTSNSFPTGPSIDAQVNLFADVFLKPKVAVGTITAFQQTEFIANGTYSYLFFNGTWAIAITFNQDGTWAVKLQLTGAAEDHGIDFIAQLTVDSDHRLTFVSLSDSDKQIQLIRDSDTIAVKLSWLSKGGYIKLA